VALRLLGESAAQVSWRYGAFELDPTVPAEGIDAQEHLKGKYAPHLIAEMNERLAGIAHDEGLPLRDLGAPSVRPNTFDAHRLLAAALPDGVARQQALGDELFAAYWARGENVGLRDVLADAAAAAGLSPELVATVLDGDDYAVAVRAEERLAADLGIRAVPGFVIADRFLVSGAQPPAALAEAVRKALE
jgi:predicted DsbA family dithiol-disulfide isomerase